MDPLVIIEEGLLLLLIQNEDLQAFTPTPGFYLNASPQSAADPNLIISKISSTPDSTNDGPSGLNMRRYQFTFMSQSYPNCVRLQEAVRQVFEGFSGTLPNGQRVYDVIRDNELDGFDYVTGEHRSMTDYFIHFAD